MTSLRTKSRSSPGAARHVIVGFVVLATCAACGNQIAVDDPGERPPTTSVRSAVPSRTAAPLPSTPAAEPSVSEQPSNAESTDSAPADLAELLRLDGFEGLQSDLNGPAGLAVVRLRPGTDAVVEHAQAGSLRSGVAWSTAKVPVVLAALRRDQSSTVRALAREAITRSDNAAAESLWRRLGLPAKAAAAADAELRREGDDHTRTESVPTRAGFSAFGQTVWTLRRQAAFATGLPCGPSQDVVELMQMVIAEQRWGMGSIPGVAIKGGWGPGVGGGYLVRQLAVFSTTDGATWGLAMAETAPSGYAAGSSDLTKIARWFERKLVRADIEIDPDGPGCASG